MSAIISDLSNGQESKKVPVFLDFNFDYITAMEVAPELKRMLTVAAENESQQNLPEMLECANLDFQVFNAGSRKGWGLRAAQQIGQSNLALFEYTGVLKMANAYHGEEDDYIFGFEYNGHHFLVDANRKGNLARFCNHSCDPNCYTQLVVTNGGMPHLFVCTKRQIEKDEELTLDYGEDWWTVKSTLNCACGSKMCQYNGKEDEDVRFNEDEEDEEENEEDEEEEEDDENGATPHPQGCIATKSVGRISYATKAVNGPIPRKQTASKAVNGPIPKEMRNRKMARKAVSGPIPKQMQKRNMAKKWIG